MSKQGTTMDLPVIDAHAAGIDIGTRIQLAAVPLELCDTPVQVFQCFTADIERMADWLVSLGVKTVVMESTGVMAHVLCPPQSEARERLMSQGSFGRS